MADPISLTVTKFIRADRQKVFAAWVTPEIMDQWFCPRDLTIADSSSDVRVGGSFHAVMEGDGKTFTVRGVYREVVANEKLVFTHRWDEPEAVETLVTVELTERDGGTLVTLTHTNFRNEETRRGHEQGWQSTLDGLETYFAKSGAA
ncbi:MAG TPA: SRPBCC domain-containing protein [Polyangiales bacterium]|nr:SRPBCC domain-containing protein [Polyangiales bacterium]